MSISVQCQKCGQRYKVSGASAGRSIACQKCQAAIVVPKVDDLMPPSAGFPPSRAAGPPPVKSPPPAPPPPLAQPVEMAAPKSAAPVAPVAEPVDPYAEPAMVPMAAAVQISAADARLDDVRSDAVEDLLDEQDQVDRDRFRSLRSWFRNPPDLQDMMAFVFSHKLVTLIAMLAVLFVAEYLREGEPIYAVAFGISGLAVFYAGVHQTLSRNATYQAFAWCYLVVLSVFPILLAFKDELGIAGTKALQNPTAVAVAPVAQSPSLGNTLPPAVIAPELGVTTEVPPSLQIEDVTLDSARESERTGGHLKVVLPAGEHAPASLGVILLAPTGTDLFSGAGFAAADEADYAVYAATGFVVVAFDLDGQLENAQAATDEQRADAFDQFTVARAGVVNASHALDWVLKKLPAADPKRIYVAGYGSGGTLAWQFAEHETRLAGCIAFVPRLDFAEQLAATPALKELPDVEEFVARHAPTRADAQPKCPVLVVQSDQEVAGEIKEFLQKSPENVALISLAAAKTHEQVMSEGLVKSLSWMQSYQRRNPRPAASAIAIAANASPPPVTAPDASAAFSAPPPESIAPAPPPIRTEPVVLTTHDELCHAAERAFHTAETEQAYHYVYADALAHDDSDVWQWMRWNPVLKRPAVSIRWGVGVDLNDLAAQGLKSPIGNHLQGKPGLETQRTLGTDFHKITGVLGSLVSNALRDGFDKGELGNLDLILSPTDRTLRGTTYLAPDTPPELLRAARARELDFLFIFSIRATASSPAPVVTPRIVDVASGSEIYPTGKSKLNLRKQVEGALVYLDKELRLTDAPEAIDREVVQARFKALASKKPDNPLSYLLELRYYLREKKLPVAEVRKYMSGLIGSEDAAVLASGSSEQRQKLIGKWLPQG